MYSLFTKHQDEKSDSEYCRCHWHEGFAQVHKLDWLPRIALFGKHNLFLAFAWRPDTGLHNSWVRNNGTTQHNFCWFHCWVPINPHQLMFIKGWVPNISNQQLCNQQLVSIWSAWLLGTQLLGCAAFDPTLDQTFQILSLFVELVSKI